MSRKIVDDSLFGLLKLPDKVILEECQKENKKLRQTIGEQESYIHELEYEIQARNKEIVGLISENENIIKNVLGISDDELKQRKFEVKTELAYKGIKETLKAVEKKNRQLKTALEILSQRYKFSNSEIKRAMNINIEEQNVEVLD